MDDVGLVGDGEWIASPPDGLIGDPEAIRQGSLSVSCDDQVFGRKGSRGYDRGDSLQVLESAGVHHGDGGVLDRLADNGWKSVVVGF